MFNSTLYFKPCLLFGKVLLVMLLGNFPVASQNVSYESFGKGLSVMAADSSFTLKLGVRFQTLYAGVLNFDSDNWSDQFLIRRARLKFDGFAFSPKLEYKIELGLSNRDTGGGQNVQSGFTSRIILDAVLKWKFHKDWALWVGQTKLPGNRERVISSQKLQFVDRSLVNSRFNIDRDIGIQLRHKDRVGSKGVLKEMAAISMGEGRDITTPNIGGYDYTLRLEYLPFGEFASKGDYFSSDLKREPEPKLAIGVTYDFNDDAGKTRGQLGTFTIDSTMTQITNDLTAVFVDAIFKYKGWSIQSEYAHKSAGEDIIVSSLEGDLKYGTGHGFVLQTGYLFPSNFELAGRYTKIKPDSETYSSLGERMEYAIGLSRYIVEHNLKVQSDVSIIERPGGSDFFQFRLQFELAF
ncbi:MAG: OprO/OprP family phosphate-selective porin [Cyclobacteriaceae bacterium]|nr:OprO/OprP family phosphate-selective porin [Cyclobacteriaceae bacterium]